MNSFVMRGMLIGSSLGIFAALAGVVSYMPRAFFVGMLAGALAGLTMGRLQKSKAKNRDENKA